MSLNVFSRYKYCHPCHSLSVETNRVLRVCTLLKTACDRRVRHHTRPFEAI